MMMVRKQEADKFSYLATHVEINEIKLFGAFQWNRIACVHKCVCYS